ncbi:hypothetical protein CJD36_009850 [Flavipsychrobacter stenotrophus]|uniref:Secretion system C-terminal sorting domain-containing protein n=1 Tax=Flavipsychrobacter stenotrophus TaxID=2077091 RepID=A0A2S7SZP6_9BACT|nr:T9SS type A sorting domain-containing protein [Flavipsychrobacter stenotrophus]PQJ12081.1 hypothetical protein CJD36_009850 [Flavipsychrobacter stenotrophus]
MKFSSRLLCVICFLCLFSVTSSRASHVYSSEIFYNHVSDSTYNVSVTLYIDCVTGVPDLYTTLPDNRIFICAYDAHTLVDTFVLTRGIADTPVDMPNPCGIDAPTQCRSLTSIIPGVRKYTFSGTYTLPHRSATWRFICTGSTNQLLGRTGTTNLSDNGYLIALEADLNSLYHNSSPALGSFMPSYFCINSSSSYHPNATDPENDNLTFDLVAPVTIGNDSAYFLSDYTSPLAYKPPYTATSPLATAAGSFTFSNATGGMSFTPNKQQRSIVVYNIEERRGGVLVGTSQHEMIVLAEVCSDPYNIDSAATIYPVPANDKVFISLPTMQYSKVSVRNMLGQFIWEQPITYNVTQLNTSGFPAGIYFLILEGKTTRRVQKIVISR